MIVELFGPPGAGKSTVSKALAEKLRQQGKFVEFDASARPSELPPNASYIERTVRLLGGSPLLRLVRATTEFCVAALAGESAHSPITVSLSEVFPQQGTFWRLRLAQYMKRLSGRWQRAASANEITIFDQAYAQALVSYAALSRREYRQALAVALQNIPKANLLIYIEAPYATLVHRLVSRAEHQGWLERRFELDLESNIQAIDVAACLYEFAEEQGLHVMKGRSDDESFVEECLREVKRLSERSRDVEPGEIV